MATGHWLTNRGKLDLLANKGSAFKIGLMTVQGVAADTQIEVADLNTVTDLIVTAGCTEATATNYARIALASFTKTEDDANDRVNIDFADVVWNPLGGATNNTILGAFIYDATVDTNDTTRELVSVDWFTAGVPTNGGSFTYAIADLYRLS